MKSIRKISILGFCCLSVLLLDVASLHMVQDAYAIYGTRRRTARRTAVIVHHADSEANEAAQQQAAASQQQAAAAQQDAAAAQQQTAAAQQQAAQAEQEAAAAKAEAAAAQQRADAAQHEAEIAKQQAAAAQAPHAAPALLPMGTVATALPAGCTKQVVGDVEYYNDGTNFYRAAFQGSQLIYVTTKP